MPRPVEAGEPDLQTAFGVVEKALASVEPGGLQNLLDTIRLLVAEPTNKDKRRDYVLSLLSGELPKSESKRKTANA